MTGILFDLDGTLLDTLDDLAAGVNYALKTLGYPERSREEVRRFVGNGAEQLMVQAVPRGEDHHEVLALFQPYYREHCRIRTAPYAGVQEALREIQRDHPVAIVSNKPDAAVKKLCADYFPGVFARGESADCPRKPKPDMLYQTMQKCGMDTCIYIGDSEVDVVTAANAGVPCISVLWGFRDEKQLKAAGAQIFCAAPADLPGLIARLVHDTAGGIKHGI